MAKSPRFAMQPISLARACMEAGLQREPLPGDVFFTKMYGKTVCKEYDAKAPDGMYLGTYDPGMRLVALDVCVVLIPAWGRLPAQWGVAIAVDSFFRPGSTAWVNISRGHVSFVETESRHSKGPGKSRRWPQDDRASPYGT